MVTKLWCLVYLVSCVCAQVRIPDSKNVEPIYEPHKKQSTEKHNKVAPKPPRGDELEVDPNSISFRQNEEGNPAEHEMRQKTIVTTPLQYKDSLAASKGNDKASEDIRIVSSNTVPWNEQFMTKYQYTLPFQNFKTYNLGKSNEVETPVANRLSAAPQVEYWNDLIESWFSNGNKISTSDEGMYKLNANDRDYWTKHTSPSTVLSRSRAYSYDANGNQNIHPGFYFKGGSKTRGKYYPSDVLHNNIDVSVDNTQVPNMLKNVNIKNLARSKYGKRIKLNEKWDSNSKIYNYDPDKYQIMDYPSIKYETNVVTQQDMQNPSTIHLKNILGESDRIKNPVYNIQEQKPDVSEVQKQFVDYQNKLLESSQKWKGNRNMQDYSINFSPSGAASSQTFSPDVGVLSSVDIPGNKKQTSEYYTKNLPKGYAINRKQVSINDPNFSVQPVRNGFPFISSLPNNSPMLYDQQINYINPVESISEKKGGEPSLAIVNITIHHIMPTDTGTSEEYIINHPLKHNRKESSNVGSSFEVNNIIPYLTNVQIPNVHRYDRLQKTSKLPFSPVNQQSKVIQYGNDQLPQYQEDVIVENPTIPDVNTIQVSSLVDVLPDISIPQSPPKSITSSQVPVKTKSNVGINRSSKIVNQSSDTIQNSPVITTDEASVSNSYPRKDKDTSNLETEMYLPSVTLNKQITNIDNISKPSKQFDITAKYPKVYEDTLNEVLIPHPAVKIPQSEVTNLADTLKDPSDIYMKRKISPYGMPNSFFSTLPGGITKNMEVSKGIFNDDIPNRFFSTLPGGITKNVEITKGIISDGMPNRFFSTLPSGITKNMEVSKGIFSDGMPNRFFSTLPGGITKNMEVSKGIFSDGMPNRFFSTLPGGITKNMEITKGIFSDGMPNRYFSTLPGGITKNMEITKGIFSDGMPNRFFSTLPGGITKNMKVSKGIFSDSPNRAANFFIKYPLFHSVPQSFLYGVNTKDHQIYGDVLNKPTLSSYLPHDDSVHSSQFENWQPGSKMPSPQVFKNLLKGQTSWPLSGHSSNVMTTIPSGFTGTNLYKKPGQPDFQTLQDFMNYLLPPNIYDKSPNIGFHNTNPNYVWNYGYPLSNVHKPGANIGTGQNLMFSHLPGQNSVQFADLLNNPDLPSLGPQASVLEMLNKINPKQTVIKNPEVPSSFDDDQVIIKKENFYNSPGNYMQIFNKNSKPGIIQNYQTDNILPPDIINNFPVGQLNNLPNIQTDTSRWYGRKSPPNKSREYMDAITGVPHISTNGFVNTDNNPSFADLEYDVPLRWTENNVQPFSPPNNINFNMETDPIHSIISAYPNGKMELPIYVLIGNKYNPILEDNNSLNGKINKPVRYKIIDGKLIPLPGHYFTLFNPKLSKFNYLPKNGIEKAVIESLDLLQFGGMNTPTVEAKPEMKNYARQSKENPTITDDKNLIGEMNKNVNMINVGDILKLGIGNIGISDETQNVMHSPIFSGKFGNSMKFEQGNQGNLIGSNPQKLSYQAGIGMFSDVRPSLYQEYDNQVSLGSTKSFHGRDEDFATATSEWPFKIRSSKHFLTSNNNQGENIEFKQILPSLNAVVNEAQSPYLQLRVKKNMGEQYPFNFDPYGLYYKKRCFEGGKNCVKSTNRIQGNNRETRQNYDLTSDSRYMPNFTKRKTSSFNGYYKRAMKNRGNNIDPKELVVENRMPQYVSDSQNTKK